MTSKVPVFARRRPSLLFVVAVLAFVVIPTIVGQSATASASVPTVSLTTTALAHSNGAHELGANQRWPNNADGALTTDTSGAISSSAVTAAQNMGLDDLRYPGGTVANMFNWANSEPNTAPDCQTVGGFTSAPFKRLAGTNSQFTISKAADYAGQVGAAINVMVPMINTSPAEAVNFVQSVKDQTGATNIVVEIGNEPYQTSQRYWRSSTESTRLHQYIYGGTQAQASGTGDYANNLALFAPGTCDLFNSATADGTANQTYVSRFGPIATSPQPTITVAGQTWTYVSSLDPTDQGQHVFTLSSDHREVVFGDDSNGAMPDGTMTIHYTTANQGGYNEYYQALHDAFGSRVDVCSGWGKTSSAGVNDFVTEMNSSGNPYDCVAFHQYAPMPTAGESGSQLVTDTMTNAGNWADRLSGLNGQIHQGDYSIHPNRRIVVSEFGTLDPNGYNGKFISILQKSRLLLSQYRHQVTISEFATLQSMFTFTDGEVTGRSANGYLATMFAKLPDAQPVEVSGVPGGAPIKPVAVRTGTEAGIVVLNTSGSSDFSAAMKSGLEASCMQTYRLNATPLADLSTTKVRDTPTVQQVGSGGAPQVTFPAHSVTLLKWVGRNADGSCATPSW